MRCWFYRLTAMASGALGLALIVLVWRAVYIMDHTAQTLMFTLGMPLVLLSTLIGALLLSTARHLLNAAGHPHALRP